jgi:hypothetical protein
MLLYGRNRVGKTTFACDFPKPLLLVSLEPSPTGGAKSIKKIPGIKVLRYPDELKSSEDISLLPSQLKGSDYKTVVVDSGSSFDEILLAEICGWETTADLIAFGPNKPGAKVTTDQYTERSEKFRKIIRGYLNLRMHVVIICNEKDHNPPEGRKSSFAKGAQSESFFGAATGSGVARWLQDSCDVVCQLLMDKEYVTKIGKVGGKDTPYTEETGNFVRKLRTKYHPNYAAGLRSEYGDDGVPEFVDRPKFSDVLKIVKEGKK